MSFHDLGDDTMYVFRRVLCRHRARLDTVVLPRQQAMQWPPVWPFSLRGVSYDSCISNYHVPLLSLRRKLFRLTHIWNLLTFGMCTFIMLKYRVVLKPNT